MKNIIQIGANIGDDHVTKFLKKYNYDKALLVEAHPLCMSGLFENYSNWSDISIECAIISHTNDIVKNLWYHAKTNYEVSSTKENHQPLWITPKKQIKYRLNLPNFTFDQLVEKHGFEDVNILFMDIEGQDELLIKSIDFNKYNIDFLVWEQRHSPDMNEETINRLKSFGFKTQRIHANTMAWRNDLKFDIEL